MPKLIRVDKPNHTVKHTDCGAVIEYYSNEVKSFIYSDYGGGNEKVYYIVCPNCNENVILSK